MLHVLEDHDERVALHADAVELDDVLVLEVGQQLRLAMEVLASVVAGVLQRLGMRGTQGRKSTHLKLRTSRGRLRGEGMTPAGPEGPRGEGNSSHSVHKRLGNGLIPEEVLSVLDTEEQLLMGAETCAVYEALTSNRRFLTSNRHELSRVFIRFIPVITQ